MLKLTFEKPQYNSGERATKCTYVCHIKNADTNQVLEADIKSYGTAVLSKDDIKDEKFGFILSNARAKLHAYEKAMSCIYPIRWGYGVAQDMDIAKYNNLIKSYEDEVKSLQDRINLMKQLAYLRSQEYKHVHSLVETRR